MNETNGKTQCQECGVSLGRLTALHLWTKHRMTMEEYRDKFPYAEIVPGYIPRQKGDVTCMICGENLHRMTAKHLEMHDTTMAVYRDKYPHAVIVSKDDISVMGRVFEGYPSKK